MKYKIGDLIKEWQSALHSEIQHLKKYGSSKYFLTNGRLISNDTLFTYFFETSQSVRVPVGSSIKLKWGEVLAGGRILSSEGKSVIVVIEQNIGNILTEVYLYHDPWELLEQLASRLDEIRKSKKKRARIKRLMEPNEGSKHPTDNIKSKVHELMLRSKYNPVTYVWGPPGTGKTYTLARVAANKYINNKRILVLSHSNHAVNVLMAEISSFLKEKGRFKEGEILRLGSQVHNDLLMGYGITSFYLLTAFHPDLANEKDSIVDQRRLLKIDLANSFSQRDSEQLLEVEKKLGVILDKIRQKEIQFTEEAKIVGVTLAKAASDPTIYESEFDLVIVDEASMAYVPQIGFAATLAKRCIICGDFKQLPPIAVGRNSLIKRWLQEDIFHRSGVTA